ncbi:MAG: DNA repair protein [Butyrivibrio sp.]|nr:DNA repair protein [Butyrivibrio sp.]
MEQRTYIIIDLKSFYASVECAERGIDPLYNNLVVADPDRSKNTICLAVSPSLKKLGVKNRCRINEIPQALGLIIAKPRMQLYIDYAAEIYAIYLRYISKEDIHVYSIDEAFLDVTDYLDMYHVSAKELGIKIMNTILDELSIRATMGIGTNLYLAKIALDITSKHASNYIGILDEKSYRETLWDHRPLTDFWRIGPGTERRLKKYGLYNMGQVAHADEDTLYREFGIDAELLIDHAWGREITTMRDIHNYHSKNNSLSNGQVLMKDYSFEDAKLVVREMADLLCLDLVDKELVTKSITMYIGYSDTKNIPSTGGTVSFPDETNADINIIPAVVRLYEQTTYRDFPIRRVGLTCNNVIPEEFHQFNMFENLEMLDKNRRIQKAVIELKRKYGKDAVLKGMNLMENGTTKIRNHQIGGHSSGF